jgi:hypothetical protein
MTLIEYDLIIEAPENTVSGITAAESIYYLSP